MQTNKEAEQVTLSDLGICCGKMFQEPSPAELPKARTSVSSSKRSSELSAVPFMSLDLTPGHGNLLGESYWELISPWLGGAWMLNTGVSPNDARESSLSQILQDAPPIKYYLSPKACLGILRRASERGKALPPKLERALNIQAGLMCPDGQPTDLNAFHINTAAEGVQKITDTVFFERSVPLLFFDFGRSDSGRDIGHEISTRMWPSLALAVPTFLLGLIVMVAWSLLVVLFRRTRVEAAAIGLSVFLMSISSLFYIIVGQWLFSKLMRLFPISGWADGWGCTAFLVLPVLIALFSRLGSDTLLYRAMFLEEIGRDYVRTARAKGLSEGAVLRRHVLRNAALPIITSSVAVIPMLFMGSLIMESFFGIPGLGSYTIDALGAQDFSVVRTMVFLGTFAYIIGLIATDIVYARVDPRIRLA